MTTAFGTWCAALLLMSAAASDAYAQAAEIEGLRHDFHVCRTHLDASERLRCYDVMESKLEPPRFQGNLADETAPFTIEGPTLLRYQSDGPVFVMYLKNVKGDVVQNLHIGGGGESEYVITKPGTYSLQVSGTDTWRIWVEPVVAGPHG